MQTIFNDKSPDLAREKLQIKSLKRWAVKLYILIIILLLGLYPVIIIFE